MTMSKVLSAIDTLFYGTMKILNYTLKVIVIILIVAILFTALTSVFFGDKVVAANGECLPVGSAQSGWGMKYVDGKPLGCKLD